MTADLRALVAELLNGLDEVANPRYPFPGYTRCAMDLARAALAAEPVAPVGPPSEEVTELVAALRGTYRWTTLRNDQLDRAADLLVRYGSPQPVPVALTDADVVRALAKAEAALADIGDSEREPGDDLKWCERRAAEALPVVREALSFASALPSPGVK